MNESNIMNIQYIRNCYGCGLCAIACPKRIINIELNNEGFYEPNITDITDCLDCGLCCEVCAYTHKELSLQCRTPKSYAAWSNDSIIRSECSSGGIGFELGRTLIGKGYHVCGVRYNTELARAEHYIATTIDELRPSIGSKYIQSYTINGFSSINRKQKYLVTGTPCQIDSFRRYIRKFHMEDNFLLMDFFCHGVPSMLMWRKYITDVEKKIGKLTYVSWRNKRTGWHDSWAMAIESEFNKKMPIRGNNDVLKYKREHFFYSRLSQGDNFYRLFLSDACLGKACYTDCKYKDLQSSADIRIGDLWGKTYSQNEEGVSAVLTFTSKGDELLKWCNCTLVEHPLEIVTEGQMKTCPQRGYIYNKAMAVLMDENATINDVASAIKLPLKLNNLMNILKHPSKLYSYIVNRMKKI